MKRLIPFSLLLVAACGPAFKFTRTAEAPAAAKPADCNFRVVSTLEESKGYQELGVLDFNSGAYVGSMAVFLEKIGPEVCAAGGDLVVGEINGLGIYVRGIVFEKQPAATATAQQ
jgi:hypothetical protein